MLVIWPRWSNPGIIFGEKGGATYVLKRLRSTTSQQPTKEERELCEYVLRASSASPSEIVQGICYAARRWRDLALWKRAADSATNIATLGKVEIFDAVLTFEWANVTPTCVDPLSQAIAV